MTQGQKAFSSLQAKAQSLGRKLTAPEIIGVLDDWVLSGELRREGGEPKKKKEALNDEQWVASLEGEPSLRGVNIKQEIGKAQFWAKQNKRVVTRRFLTNWILKAERVVDLKAQGASHATGLKLPPPKGPEGWEKWAEQFYNLPEENAWGQIAAAINCHQFTMLPASYQARCIAASMTESFTALPIEDAKRTALRNA